MLEKDERRTAPTHEKRVEREKMADQQPTLVCFYTLPGWSVPVGPVRVIATVANYSP